MIAKAQSPEMRMDRFRANAMAGGLLVTVLLAMGMAWSIARLSSNGESQIEQVRAEERQITLAERLRWNVELIVSIGKGYFITEEPALLSNRFWRSTGSAAARRRRPTAQPSMRCG